MILSDETDHKLDPQDKAEWLAALRSGKYKKGKDHLCRRSSIEQPYTYCCLGVRAEIKGKLVESKYDKTPLYKGVLEESIFSPGLTCCCDFGLPETVERELATLNDGSDSFDPVIQFIEENL